MENEPPSSIRWKRWKQKCLCSEAAQLDKRAAEFLLDERVPLDDRFEFAVRIMCPDALTVPTLH